MLLCGTFKKGAWALTEHIVLLSFYFMVSSVSGQDGAILSAWDYPPCSARKISPKAI